MKRKEAALESVGAAVVTPVPLVKCSPVTSNHSFYIYKCVTPLDFFFSQDNFQPGFVVTQTYIIGKKLQRLHL